MDRWCITYQCNVWSNTHGCKWCKEGAFKVFNGDVTAKDDTFQDAVVNFKVDVASVNTNDEARDKHLAGDDFFNTEKYPNMTFKSTSFKKVSGKNYKLTGMLTIRDVTKP